MAAAQLPMFPAQQQQLLVMQVILYQGLLQLPVQLKIGALYRHVPRMVKNILKINYTLLLLLAFTTISY